MWFYADLGSAKIALGILMICLGRLEFLGDLLKCLWMLQDLSRYL